MEENNIKKQLEKILRGKKYSKAEDIALKANSLDLLIELMSTNKHCNQAYKILKKKKLSVNDYPNLKERFKKKYIRYLIKDISKPHIEVLLESQKELLAIFSEDLFFFKEKDLAFSIIKRHDLKNFLKKKEILEEIDNKFIYKENFYLKKEFFGPTDLLDEKCEKDFINLNDFGINEENIILVNDDKSFEIFMSEIEKKPKYVN